MPMSMQKPAAIDAQWLPRSCVGKDSLVWSTVWRQKWGEVACLLSLTYFPLHQTQVGRGQERQDPALDLCQASSRCPEPQ